MVKQQEWSHVDPCSRISSKCKLINWIYLPYPSTYLPLYLPINHRQPLPIISNHYHCHCQSFPIITYQSSWWWIINGTNHYPSSLGCLGKIDSLETRLLENLQPLRLGPGRTSKHHDSGTSTDRPLPIDWSIWKKSERIRKSKSHPTNPKMIHNEYQSLSMMIL